MKIETVKHYGDERHTLTLSHSELQRLLGGRAVKWFCDDGALYTVTVDRSTAARMRVDRRRAVQP